MHTLETSYECHAYLEICYERYVCIETSCGCYVCIKMSYEFCIYIKMSCECYVSLEEQLCLFPKDRQLICTKWHKFSPHIYQEKHPIDPVHQIMLRLNTRITLRAIELVLETKNNNNSFRKTPPWFRRL